MDKIICFMHNFYKQFNEKINFSVIKIYGIIE